MQNENTKILIEIYTNYAPLKWDKNLNAAMRIVFCAICDGMLGDENEISSILTTLKNKFLRGKLYTSDIILLSDDITNHEYFFPINEINIIRIAKRGIPMRHKINLMHGII